MNTRRPSILAAILAAAFAPTPGAVNTETKDSTLVAPARPPWLEGMHQPFGQNFYGKTIGTRAAMRAAKKRRRVAAKQSKRGGAR